MADLTQDTAATGWVDRALLVLSPEATAALDDSDKGMLEQLRKQRVAELTTGGAPLRADDISHLRRIGEKCTDKRGQPVLTFPPR